MTPSSALWPFDNKRPVPGCCESHVYVPSLSRIQTGSQDKQFQELATVFHHLKSTSKSDNDMTLGEMQVSKRKGCQKIEMWSCREHRLYRPVARTTLLITPLPFKLKVKCTSESPLSDNLTLNEGGKLTHRLFNLTLISIFPMDALNFLLKHLSQHLPTPCPKEGC